VGGYLSGGVGGPCVPRVGASSWTGDIITDVVEIRIAFRDPSATLTLKKWAVGEKTPISWWDEVGGSALADIVRF